MNVSFKNGILSFIETILLILLPGILNYNKIYSLPIITLFILWFIWTWSEKEQCIFDQKSGSYDKYTFELIIIGIYFTQLVTIIDYYLKVYNFSIIIYCIGLLFWILGIIIRKVGICTLGKQFTAVIQVKENYILIDDGIYKYIRHPGYLGELISFLGTIIITKSIKGFFVYLIILLPIYYLRIINEEKMLTSNFGNHYKKYMKRSKKLLPFIF